LQGLNVKKGLDDYIIPLKAASKQAIALKNYAPSDPTHLAFSKNSLITILERDQVNGWYSGKLGTNTGWL